MSRRERDIIYDKIRREESLTKRQVMLLELDQERDRKRKLWHDRIIAARLSGCSCWWAGSCLKKWGVYVPPEILSGGPAIDCYRPGSLRGDQRLQWLSHPQRHIHGCQAPLCQRRHHRNRVIHLATEPGQVVAKDPASPQRYWATYSLEWGRGNWNGVWDNIVRLHEQ